MARGRMIDKRVGMSKKLGKIPDKAKVLWFMIYPHLDKEGRIKFDDLEDLKDEIIPKFKNWPLKKLGNSLNELANIGLIRLYPNENAIAIQFKRFKDFQTIRNDREADSKIPAPGVTPGDSGNYRISPALRLKLSINKGRKEGNNNKEDDLDKEFEEFWSAYREIGNKKDDIGGKQGTLKAYKTLRQKEKKATIVRAVNGYADYLKYKRLEEHFNQRKKFASTFLRSERWKEHIDFKYKPSM